MAHLRTTVPPAIWLGSMYNGLDSVMQGVRMFPNKEAQSGAGCRIEAFAC